MSSTATRSEGEDVRSQIVLQVENADQFGLFDDRQAEDGFGFPILQILVVRIRVSDRRIIEDHSLPRPNHLMKRGRGKIG